MSSSYRIDTNVSSKVGRGFLLQEVAASHGYPSALPLGKKNCARAASAAGSIQLSKPGFIPLSAIEYICLTVHTCYKMSDAQEDSLPSSRSVFDRLRRYQVTEGLTWREVGAKLGISVSTIMAVKSQNRSLGPKALYRLEQAEQDAAERRSKAEQVVESLIEGEGSARDLIEMVSRHRAGQGIPVHYIDARRGRGLPQTIKLVRPSGEGCRRLQKLYADTLDSSIVLLACLPSDQRTEAYLGLLTPATRSALQSASLELVFGEEWRAKLAALAVAEDRTGTKR